MIEVLMQVAAGSREKHVYNERTLEYRETRRTARPYPYPYGFVIGAGAADGDCVDCYVLTSEPLQAGAIVACESVGLLEQDEGGEIDHKVLAALPGQDVVLGHELLQELRDFIAALFAAYPDIHVRVGPLLPREAALQHLQEQQVVLRLDIVDNSDRLVRLTFCPFLHGPGLRERLMLAMRPRQPPSQPMGAMWPPLSPPQPTPSGSGGSGSRRRSPAVQRRLVSPAAIASVWYR